MNLYLVKELPVKNRKMTFCFAYPEDLNQAYAFYCARYRDISYNEFLHLGITEFMMKFSSMPESEPLHTILKSRVINVNDIKSKEERKHWRMLQHKNKIPDIYLSHEEIMWDLKKMAKEKKL